MFFFFPPVPPPSLCFLLPAVGGKNRPVENSKAEYTNKKFKQPEVSEERSFNQEFELAATSKFQKETAETEIFTYRSARAGTGQSVSAVSLIPPHDLQEMSNV